MTRPFTPDTVRTAIAIGYQNPTRNMIAEKVLPYMPVDGEKFSYDVYNIQDGYTVPNTKVGRKSDPNQVTFGSKTETAMCEANGLSDFVPQSDIDNAPRNYDPVNRSVNGIMNIVTLGHEVDVANLVQDDSNYSTNKNVLTNAQRFNTASTGLDPVDVIEDALKSMIVAPNYMAIGYNLWLYLRKHESITKAYYGSSGSGKLMKREEFAELFELNELLVGASQVTVSPLKSANKTAKPELKRVWGSNILLFNRDDDAPNNCTFGFTGRHGDRIAGTDPVKKTGLTGGVDVWAGEFSKPLICSEHHGYLIKNCLDT